MSAESNKEMTMLNKNEAAAHDLWEQLRNSWNRFEDTLRQIIETRAWEVLGYASFGEAWSSRMQGTRLATAAQAAHVVYALIDSGMTEAQVIEATGPGSGVGPEKVAVLARQRENGVPPELATTHVRREPQRTFTPQPVTPVVQVASGTVVRSHYREAPSEPRVIHVELSPDEYAAFRAIADRRGLDLATEATRAVKERFSRLERINGAE